MSAPNSDDLPPWRATLLAVPPNRRSWSQRDLIRGLELADKIKEKLKAPLPTTLDDENALEVLLYGVETFLLGPLDMSALRLCDQATQDKFRALVEKMNNMGADMFLNLNSSKKNLIMRTNTEWDVAGKGFAAVMAFLQLLLLRFGTIAGALLIKDMTGVAFKILDSLDSYVVDANLAKMGSGLRHATLVKALLFLRPALYLSSGVAFNMIEPAMRAVIDATATDTPRPWRVALLFDHIFKRICDLFSDEKMPEVVFGVRMDSREGKNAVADLLVAVSKTFMAALERAVTAAEAEGDDFCLAFSARRLSLCLTGSMELVTAERIKAVTDKANAALSRARAWLPKTHRILLSAGDMHLSLKDVPGEMIVTGEPWQAIMDKICVTAAVPVRVCGNCGSRSQEFMACNGCRSAWYCGRKCQILHWKSGHKVECAALKAKAAAEGAAVPATETAAEPAAAADPSTHVEGSSASFSSAKKGSKKGKKK